jgi:hypothetical protein
MVSQWATSPSRDASTFGPTEIRVEDVGSFFAWGGGEAASPSSAKVAQTPIAAIAPLRPALSARRGEREDLALT